MNKHIFFGLGLLILIGFFGEAYAFGVVSSYFEGNDFVIAPGQVKTAQLVLQNMVGEEDIRIKVVMIKDEGIGSVNEQIYLVPAQTSDTVVPVTIRVPEDTPIGTRYGVVVGFETVGAGGSGAVSLGTGIQTKIPIRVVDVSLAPEAETEGISYTNILIAVIIVLVVALLVWWLVRRRKRQV